MSHSMYRKIHVQAWLPFISHNYCVTLVAHKRSSSSTGAVVGSPLSAKRPGKSARHWENNGFCTPVSHTWLNRGKRKWVGHCSCVITTDGDLLPPKTCTKGCEEFIRCLFILLLLLWVTWLPMKCFLSALFVNSGVFFFFFYQFDQNVNLLQKCHFKDYLK